MYCRWIGTACDTATPRGTQTLHSRLISPDRIASPHTIPCPTVRLASTSRSPSPLFQSRPGLGSAFVWRSRDTFSRILSRSSKVYMLSTAQATPNCSSIQFRISAVAKPP